MIQDKMIKPSSNNFPSTLRHSLGFLPTILLRAIIEDKILDKKENINSSSQFPKIFSFQTTCLYIDISHFFDNNLEPNRNNSQKNGEENEINKKKLKIDFDEEISPEFYYFCINRYYERLISIITNHGGDVIFQGNGVFAIWPPEKKENESSAHNSNSNSDLNLDEKNLSEEKNINLCLRAMQCALEIQKNSIMEIKHGCTFISKIGCSLGECKFIIFQGLHNKYDYIVVGEALTNSCNCSKKGKNKREIVLDNKIYEFINDYINYNEFYIDGIKYCSLIEMRNRDNPIKNNKATMNLIKNNFTLEEISMKSYEISRFNHDVIFYLFQRNIFDEKWLKEIKSVTLVYLRLKMNKKDFDNPSKLQQIYLVIQEICIKNGGNIHKLSTDEQGIFILLTFGISSISSGYNELKGTLSSIELSAKLKKINVFPYIGITTGNLFCGLCGTVGNRREYSILGGSLLNAFLAMEKAVTMYGDKKSGNDNILLDEKTMMIIDGKIPCKFWKRFRSNLGFDFNLFVPQKISSLIHVHRENNLFPLLGCHLVSSDNEEYQLDEDIIREDNIIYFEENILKDCVRNLNEYKEKKSKVKIISVTGPIGCGKTMLLNKTLKTFFQMNPKLREILCNSNYEDEYPFVFSSHLIFTMDNNIILDNDIKEYRGLQIIIRDIFNILYKEESYKNQTLNLIIKNNCGKYYELFMKIFEMTDEINVNKEHFHNFRQESKFDKNSFPYINSFIYELLYKYKKFLESIYEDKLSEYLCDIPLILVIEDFDTCDENTKDFINYYLTKQENPFIIITEESFPVFPCYNFLSKKEKDPFYEYNDENIIKKYKLSPYDTNEKINEFVISILYELRKAKINSVSNSIIQFLLNKTFNGIPQIIKELILYLYDKNLIYISKQNKELIPDEKLEQMILYNDFTEIKIPDFIVKKVGAIIDNYLDNLDIYILKIASVIGNMFDLTKLKQAVLLDNSANSSMNIIKDNCTNFLYEKLCELEENYMIEILYDLNIKKKDVVCKFSVPFLREILYQRTPSEYRNQIHFVMGRLVHVSNWMKSSNKMKYMNEMMELGILQKHLKFSQISLHDNFLNGKLSTIQIRDDNYLNINNLKTLIIRQICAKIKSIKINDDKNNMIKAGYIYKKSDGKITWEYRYFVLTTNRVLYFYTEEDYKETNKTPLGIFYLQNLFDIKLMTDGYIGGRKNIISLIVNEWIKRGEVMSPRVYYLSVEDREEAYKWVITFSILKIKAFYENYCSGFGYVNFPIYSLDKKEFISKQKKIKFKFPEKLECDIIINRRRNTKRHSIYNPYLSLGKIENKYNTLEFEKYIIKQFSIYIKFLITYSISTFLSNVQLGLSQDSEEYEDSKLYSHKEIGHFDFANPIFYEIIMEKEEKNAKKVLKDIGEITLKYKSYLKSSGLYSANKSEYSKKQIENFKKSYLYQEKINYVKIDISNKIKEYEEEKIVKNGKLCGALNNDSLSFRDLEDPELDKEDYLKYLDYTDYDGKLKEQYRRVDSNSLKNLSLAEKNSKKRAKFGSNTKLENIEYIQNKLETTESSKYKYKENELKLLNEYEINSNDSNSEPIKRKSKILEVKKNLVINEIKEEEQTNQSNQSNDDDKKEEIVKRPKKKKSSKKRKHKGKSKSVKKKEEKEDKKDEKEKKEIKIIDNEKEINTKSNKSKDSKKIIREKSNHTSDKNTISKDSKNNINDLDNESGKFQTSQGDFKDLVIKMKKLTNENKNRNLPQNQNNIKTIEYAYNDKEIKETEKKSKDTVSLKNTSGRFVFTLNGSNEKSDEKTNTKEKVESEEKTEKSKSTKKEMIQEEVKENENTKKKKGEENENVSFSTQKKEKEKEKEHMIHNSNRLKENSLNSISSIDNNIESTKYLNGKNFDSINKLIADIGSRRWRRKSNITSGHFRKNLLNDMISFSSSYSNNIFNNNGEIKTRRNSNFHFRFSRCFSTKNIQNQNDFNIPTILNNLKNINNEKTEENNNPTQEDSLGLINKLKNLKVSLENEKSFSNILKNIKLVQNNKNKENENKQQTQRNENIRSRNKNNINNRASTRSTDKNTLSTKSTGSNIFYPNVFYINPDTNLHKKIHCSTIFSKLKQEK